MVKKASLSNPWPLGPVSVCVTQMIGYLYLVALGSSLLFTGFLQLQQVGSTV